MNKWERDNPQWASRGTATLAWYSGAPRVGSMPEHTNEYVAEHAATVLTGYIERWLAKRQAARESLVRLLSALARDGSRLSRSIPGIDTDPSNVA